MKHEITRKMEVRRGRKKNKKRKIGNNKVWVKMKHILPVLSLLLESNLSWMYFLANFSRQNVVHLSLAVIYTRQCALYTILLPFSHALFVQKPLCVHPLSQPLLFRLWTLPQYTQSQTYPEIMQECLQGAGMIASRLRVICLSY